MRRRPKANAAHLKVAATNARPIADVPATSFLCQGKSAKSPRSHTERRVPATHLQALSDRRAIGKEVSRYEQGQGSDERAKSHSCTPRRAVSRFGTGLV